MLNTVKGLSMSKKVAIVVAIAFAITMLFAQTSPVFAVADDPVGYENYATYVNSSTPPLTTQEATVTFTYTDDLDFAAGYDEDDLVDYFTVLLAGRNVETSAYQRVLSVTVDGNQLTVELSSWVLGAPGVIAQFSGLINIVSSGLGDILTVDGDPVEDIDLTTILPLGTVAYTLIVEGGAGTASIEITSVPTVRGILSIGIYQLVDGELVPIDTTLNAQEAALSPVYVNGVNAYIAHFPNFDTVTTTAAAAAQIAQYLTDGGTVANPAPMLADGYTITADGSTLTVTGPSDETLYLYIFDDNLIQEVNAAAGGDESQGDAIVTYDTIANATISGTLPYVPDI
jgi:hypothetical protein